MPWFFYDQRASNSCPRVNPAGKNLSENSFWKKLKKLLNPCTCYYIIWDALNSKIIQDTWILRIILVSLKLEVFSLDDHKMASGNY